MAGVLDVLSIRNMLARPDLTKSHTYEDRVSLGNGSLNCASSRAVLQIQGGTSVLGNGIWDTPSPCPLPPAAPFCSDELVPQLLSLGLCR